MKTVLLILLLLVQVDLKENAEKIISSYFNKNIKMVFQKFELPIEIKTKIEKECNQRFFNKYIYLWKIFDDGKLIGIAMLDNVLGKSLPITFIVIFDSEGRILTAEIVKYRESYGNAVQEKSWLNQFNGKDVNHQFKVGKDVSSISGATISANSVTTGIKKLSILFSLIKDTL
ncbi:MAG: FMN-binding protein [Melioribacter sp.]|uniref:FMN-binding protein n=1 Tax=Rosettibacter primus TaxID=3111523 RepID=UPI00247CA957|nr:FMN-binding protein [Melioribacter sp.]